MLAAHDDALADLKVIDTDTHLSEPADLWTSRAPARDRDRVPRQVTRDGRTRWIVGDDIDLGGAGASSVVDRDGAKMLGIGWMKMSVDEVHDASSQVPARVAMMDTLGIHAQVVYPNVACFGNQAFLRIDDAGLRLLCAQLYNDAVAEMQQASGGRLFPMALVPWWDLDAAVTEVRRCAAMGLRGVVTCSNPEEAGRPDLAQPAWVPFFEACQELALPINFHIGSSAGAMDFYGKAPWPSLPNEARLALGSSNLFLGNARVIGNLIYSGVAERFPGCRFVSVESGIGWLPFYLDALTWEMGETMPNASARLRLTPWEYFQRQFFGCFWFEHTNLAATVAALGAQSVLFETDFPHPTCLYPEPRQQIRAVLDALDPESACRVLQDNAAALYRIPV